MIQCPLHCPSCIRVGRAPRIIWRRIARLDGMSSTNRAKTRGDRSFPFLLLLICRSRSHSPFLPFVVCNMQRPGRSERASEAKKCKFPSFIRWSPHNTYSSSSHSAFDDFLQCCFAASTYPQGCFSPAFLPVGQHFHAFRMGPSMLLGSEDEASRSDFASVLSESSEKGSIINEVAEAHNLELQR